MNDIEKVWCCVSCKRYRKRADMVLLGICKDCYEVLGEIAYEGDLGLREDLGEEV